MPLQSHLSSLALVRLFRDWMPAPGESSRQDVAAQLGEGLNAFDSVKLDGALQAIASYGSQAPRRQRGQPVDAPGLEALCRRMKAELTDLITATVTPARPSPSSSPARGTADRAAPDDADTTPKADYGPHHQRYAAVQQQMETKLSACRAQVRQVLSKASPRLRQLAALDGVMAEMLADREQKLLAAVPVYLERRFTHWRQAHQNKLAAAGPADEEDDPRRWQEVGGWLHGFQQDMRQMLLAELQLRLQPILGLIEAAQEEDRQFQHTQQA